MKKIKSILMGVCAVTQIFGNDRSPQNWNDRPDLTEAVQADPQEPIVIWEETNVWIRAILGQQDESDLPFYAAYGIPTDQGRLSLMLGIFMNPAIMKTPINEETVHWFESIRAFLGDQCSNNEITKDEDVIFKGMLPDATPEELHGAGEALGNLESTYWVGVAAYFYEVAAHHHDALPEDIRLAAESLAEMGEEYYQSAVILLVKAADHKDATPETIERALEGLILCENIDVYSSYTLSDSQYKTAWRHIANMLLNHPDVTPVHKVSAEKFLTKL